MKQIIRKVTIAVSLFWVCQANGDPRGTGDLGVVIERETGSIQIVNTTKPASLSHIQGLGDLSHASIVFSRDQRYAYVFGRDGGLTKIDLLQDKIDKRIIQAGNSIGGAISQDGKVIAVSNYTPGGVKLFDAVTLEQLAEIPAIYGEDNKLSKVVGLVDAPGQRFVCSLFEGNEIWLIDAKNPRQPGVKKFKDVGKQPYDALLTPDGHFYGAGLFGEKGLALLDLWQPENGVEHILEDYGKDDEQMPVYKMPHLEGWTVAGDWLLVPAVGLHEVLVIDTREWELVKRIPVAGQPVFVTSRPDGRQVWVNFAFPDNQTVEVIDLKDFNVLKTLQPGKAVLHMEFSPRGESVWLAVRDEDRVMVYDTETFAETARLPAQKPSGIFFTDRANRIGW
ncbi:cytochrome D1 domain-containing protein [Methylomonas sp. OY6]|uniref:Cytochrome D1 domain-containing protein n=1 Tax=Methylomonas defluvii TaxID=3045149 RepID=A0ABU4UL69_9GAMM|nr:cytochrome D1 domain-containing protein [Methylomonas sp. OY6]MDX8130235.1 cytochrome D1 domain-containing protein [Methylomonas sp. OY6]